MPAKNPLALWRHSSTTGTGAAGAWRGGQGTRKATRGGWGNAMIWEYWKSVPPGVRHVITRMARIAAIAVAADALYGIIGPDHRPFHRPHHSWQGKISDDKARRHHGRRV